MERLDMLSEGYYTGSISDLLLEADTPATEAQKKKIENSLNKAYKSALSDLKSIEGLGATIGSDAVKRVVPLLRQKLTAIKLGDEKVSAFGAKVQQLTDAGAAISKIGSDINTALSTVTDALKQAGINTADESLQEKTLNEIIDESEDENALKKISDIKKQIVKSIAADQKGFFNTLRKVFKGFVGASDMPKLNAKMFADDVFGMKLSVLNQYEGSKLAADLSSAADRGDTVTQVATSMTAAGVSTQRPGAIERLASPAPEAAGSPASPAAASAPGDAAPAAAAAKASSTAAAPSAPGGSGTPASGAEGSTDEPGKSALTGDASKKIKYADLADKLKDSAKKSIVSDVVTPELIDKFVNALKTQTSAASIFEESANRHLHRYPLSRLLFEADEGATIKANEIISAVETATSGLDDVSIHDVRQKLIFLILEYVQAARIGDGAFRSQLDAYGSEENRLYIVKSNPDKSGEGESTSDKPSSQSPTRAPQRQAGGAQPVNNAESPAENSKKQTTPIAREIWANLIEPDAEHEDIDEFIGLVNNHGNSKGKIIENKKSLFTESRWAKLAGIKEEG